MSKEIKALFSIIPYKIRKPLAVYDSEYISASLLILIEKFSVLLFQPSQEVTKTRFEQEINIYEKNATLKRFQALETSLSVTQGNISALISSSELIELQNSKATMYSRLTSAEMNISGISEKYTDLSTKYDTVTGKYDSVSSQMAEYKRTVDGISTSITTINSKFDDYSTTEAMNTAINASSEKLSVEIGKKVGSSEVTSLISQNAEKIRLQASKISWKSDNSEMTEAGELTCKKGTIAGWIIESAGLRSPSDTMYINATKGSIYTRRDNEKRGTSLTSAGIVIYSYITDEKEIGYLSSGNILKSDEDFVTLTALPKNSIGIGFEVSGSSSQDVYIALTDHDHDGYKTGVLIKKDLYCLSNVEVSNTLKVNTLSVENISTVLNAKQGIAFGSNLLYPAQGETWMQGKFHADQLYSQGYGVALAGSSNKIIFSWTGSALQVTIDKTIIGTVKFN